MKISFNQDALSSDQLSSDQLISNQLIQNQIDQQIENSIDNAQLDREEDQTFINDSNINESETIDLFSSSQKIETEFFFFNKKRKTREER
jgi:hypothetical protein